MRGNGERRGEVDGEKVGGRVSKGKRFHIAKFVAKRVQTRNVFLPTTYLYGYTWQEGRQKERGTRSRRKREIEGEKANTRFHIAKFVEKREWSIRYATLPNMDTYG